MITVADRKSEWSFTPAFTHVYGDDVEATLAPAGEHGATIITRRTEFFGDALSRFQDPLGNLPLPSADKRSSALRPNEG